MRSLGVFFALWKWSYIVIFGIFYVLIFMSRLVDVLYSIVGVCRCVVCYSRYT